MTCALPKPVFRLLRNVRKNWEKRDAAWAFDELARLKRGAVKSGDEKLAKHLWVYETILQIQSHYIEFFLKAKKREFYTAWCALEKAEIQMLFLRRHCEIGEAFGLAIMQKLIPQFQDLFPYAVFMSPEFVIREESCSICGGRITAVRKCLHHVGEIYAGEMCCQVVKDAELLAVSMVQNPVQKYSVPFSTNEEGKTVDHHDYGLVDYVVSALLTPFVDWDYVKTTIRHPHSRFPGITPEDKCPCDSGLPYKECCLPHPKGVLRPHYQFQFSVNPPPSHPRFEYTEDRPVRSVSGNPIPGEDL